MFKKKKCIFEILKRSNVIQYDDMGYSLRLCIVRDGNRTHQMWLDTTEQENDVVLKWSK